MGLAELLATRLPMNRKERYFTGMVLPMIVACDGSAFPIEAFVAKIDAAG